MATGADDIPVRSRFTVAALAAALALPLGAGSCGILIVGSFPMDGHRPNLLILGPALLVFGCIWIYETGSRLTGGKIDGHPFSMARVAVGTMLGLLAGLPAIFLVDHTILFLFTPVAGAFVGALAATRAREQAGTRTSTPDSSEAP